MEWNYGDTGPAGKSPLGFPAGTPARSALEALPAQCEGQGVSCIVRNEYRDLLFLPRINRWSRSAIFLGLLPVLGAGGRRPLSKHLSTFLVPRATAVEFRHCQSDCVQLGVCDQRRL